MNKLIVLSNAIVLIATSCKNSQEAPDSFSLNHNFAPYVDGKLNGKIEKMSEKMYWGVADGDIIKTGSLITSKEADSLGWGYTYEVTFDRVGNLLNCRYFDENNKYLGGYHFFRKNNLLDSAIKDWRDETYVYEKLICNEKGWLIGASGYNANADTLLYSWTKHFSKAGDTIEYRYFNNKGDLSVKVVNLYNEKGQLISYDSYDNDGVLFSASKLFYNDKGKISAATNFNKFKKKVRAFNKTYEYDLTGNWVRSVSTDQNGYIAIAERTYSYFR